MGQQEKFKEAPTTEKVIMVMCISLLVFMLLGVNSNVNTTVYGTVCIIFYILMGLVMPVLGYRKRIKEKQVNQGLKTVFIMYMINGIVFMFAFYRVLISNHYELYLSYYFLLGSSLLFIIIKMRLRKYEYLQDIKDIDEKNKRKNKIRRILYYVGLVSLLFSIVLGMLPSVYTVSSGEELKELKKSSSLGICIRHGRGDYSENKDMNDDLIDEIINQLNENKIEKINGIEALNCLKRNGKSDYYMIGTFWPKEGRGIVSLDIYPDGYTVLCRYCFDKGTMYEKYYKVNLSQETLEKIYRCFKTKKQQGFKLSRLNPCCCNFSIYFN